MNKPISIWLDQSDVSALYNILYSDSEQFKLVDNAEQAEIILFENDNPNYIRQSWEFKQWPHKCIVVSECDEPTYFLPACYSSNKRSLLSFNRAKTIPFLVSQRSNANPFIKDVGDNRPCNYLYSFIGGSTSWVRKRLFKNPPQHHDVYIKDTNQYQHWNYEFSYTDQKLSQQKIYAEIMKQSSFILCPRGAGVSSIRLFEVMQAGRVPVIISDDWIPIENIPWHEFAIFVSEKDIKKIDAIIRLHEHSANELGNKAKRAWKNYCAPGADLRLLAQALQFIQLNRNETKEFFLRSLFPILEVSHSVKKRVLHSFKHLILFGFNLTGAKFPYSLNRPLDEQLHSKK